MTELDGKYGEDFDPKAYCNHDWEVKALSPNVFQGNCRKCDTVRMEVLHYTLWHKNQKENPFISILGKQYRALKSWGNIAPCSECRKVFLAVPLILWDSNDYEKAVVFCPKCGDMILERLIKHDKVVLVGQKTEK